MAISNRHSQIAIRKITTTCLKLLTLTLSAGLNIGERPGQELGHGAIDLVL